jgi:hypothetical protein
MIIYILDDYVVARQSKIAVSLKMIIPMNNPPQFTVLYHFPSNVYTNTFNTLSDIFEVAPIQIYKIALEKEKFKISKAELDEIFSFFEVIEKKLKIQNIH